MNTTTLRELEVEYLENLYALGANEMTENNATLLAGIIADAMDAEKCMGRDLPSYCYQCGEHVAQTAPCDCKFPESFRKPPKH
jgi:hypothetical protein